MTYTFNAATKQITFTSGSPVLSSISRISNITANKDIYLINREGYGGNLSGNILTLNFNTVGMNNGDNIQIYLFPNPSTINPPPFDMTQLAKETKQNDIIDELKTMNSLVPDKYDFIDMSYTGSDLTGVVFKIGGSSGTVVSTLAISYSGGNIASVLKS